MRDHADGIGMHGCPDPPRDAVRGVGVRVLDRLRVLEGPLGRVAGWRWLVLPLVAAVAGWFDRDYPIADYQLFGQAGMRLLAGDLAAVYADPIVQAGPLELLFFAPFQALDQWVPGLGRGGYTTAGTVAMLLAVMLGVRWLRRTRGMADSPRTELVVGALALAWGLCVGPFLSGHPAEAVISGLWVGAGVASQRNRPLTAGILLGCAVGWETWGVLAAPVLLLLRDPRRVVTGAAALLGTAAALFVPFVLSGRFTMLSFRWSVGEGTLPALLSAGAVHEYDWAWRAGQAGLAVLACALVVLCCRSRDVVWLAPLAAVAVRLIADPVLFGYYWIPAQLLALAGLGVSSRTRSVNVAAVAGLCWWLSVDPGQTWWGTAMVLPGVAWLTLRRPDTPDEGVPDPANASGRPSARAQVPAQGNRER